jgi:hypothetical protein
MANEWVRITLEDWHKLAIEKFGMDPNKWKFTCPSCGHVQTRQDFLDLGMSPRNVDTIVSFSCIGRWNLRDVVGFCEKSKGSGCDYAGAGLFRISPYTVVLPTGEERPTFAFAP